MKNFKRRKDDVSLQGLTVTVRNDDVNKALRIFKKKVAEELKGDQHKIDANKNNTSWIYNLDEFRSQHAR